MMPVRYGSGTIWLPKKHLFDVSKKITIILLENTNNSETLMVLKSNVV
jgi:hypothetical protein